MREHGRWEKNSPVRPASELSCYRGSRNPSDSRQAASMALVVVATPLFDVVERVLVVDKQK